MDLLQSKQITFYFLYGHGVYLMPMKMQGGHWIQDHEDYCHIMAPRWAGKNWFMRSVDIINPQGVNPSELLAIGQHKGAIFGLCL